MMSEEQLFYIEVSSGSGTLLAPHYHAEAMEFIEVLKGRADVTVGLSTIRVSEGEILHIVPDVVHFAEAVGGEECFVRVLTYRPRAAFALDALDERILSLYVLPIENQAVLFTAEHPLYGHLRTHMEGAIAEWRGKEIFYSAQVLSHISHMLSDILRSYGYREEDSQEYRNMMRVAPIVTYIGSSYGQRLRLEDLAARLYLSPDHFGKLFRATVGMTPVDYVNHVRINAAMRYLAATDWTIAEVAQASGFSNSNYFHKVFHDLTGIGPAALRKRWRAMRKQEMFN